MNLIPASDIPNLPDTISLAWSEISPAHSPDILSDSDTLIYAEIKNEQRRSEFLTARTLLKNMMLELGWNPDEWLLNKEELGKPFLTNGMNKRFVSFSHSKQKVFAALSEDHDIGLDSEFSRREINPQIVRRILSENEWKVMGEDDPITLWTVKEAGVKCLGTGLRTNLKELHMFKKGDNTYKMQINEEPEMNAVSLEVDDHRVSIAYR